MSHDGARDVDAARALDALEARRAVDLEDLRTALALEHVDARDVEAHDLHRGHGCLRVARVEPHADAERRRGAGSSGTRPTFACRRIAATTRWPDDDGAQIAPARLGDVLLEDDVLAHRPERLEQRAHGLRRLGDHRADALRALLELHDGGRAPMSLSATGTASGVRAQTVVGTSMCFFVRSCIARSLSRERAIAIAVLSTGTPIMSNCRTTASP